MIITNNLIPKTAKVQHRFFTEFELQKLMIPDVSFLFTDPFAKLICFLGNDTLLVS